MVRRKVMIPAIRCPVSRGKFRTHRLQQKVKAAGEKILTEDLKKTDKITEQLANARSERHRI